MWFSDKFYIKGSNEVRIDFFVKINSLPLFRELIVAVDLVSSLVFRIQHAEHQDAKHL